MRKAGGYAQLVGAPLGSLMRFSGQQGPQEAKFECLEMDTFTCGHRGEVVHVMARQDPADLGGLCKQCMQLICPRCVADGRCTPLEKRLQEAEARHHALRSYGL